MTPLEEELRRENADLKAALERAAEETRLLSNRLSACHGNYDRLLDFIVECYELLRDAEWKTGKGFVEDAGCPQCDQSGPELREPHLPGCRYALALEQAHALLRREGRVST